MQKIAQGAEAILYREKDIIKKVRSQKPYRQKELDKKIRLQRTRKEAKLLTKAYELINSPKVKTVNEKEATITMEYLEGEKIADILESLPKKDQKEIAQQIGKQLAILHQNHIVHGDMTTSNMIYKDSKVFIIDFGLGFVNEKAEHKAVDLHILEQAFDAKHHTITEEMKDIIFKSYKEQHKEAEPIFARLKKVQQRGRYKTKS